MNAFLAEMKAHFADIDAVELAVETPTPPTKSYAAPDINYYPRPMSFGLSSRTPYVNRPSISFNALGSSMHGTCVHTPLNASVHKPKDNTLNILDEFERASPPLSHQELDAARTITKENVDTESQIKEGFKDERIAAASGSRSSTSNSIKDRCQAALGDTMAWLARRGSFSDATRSSVDGASSRASQRKESSISDKPLNRNVSQDTLRRSKIFTITEEQDNDKEENPPMENTKSASLKEDLEKSEVRDILAQIQEEFGAKVNLTPIKFDDEPEPDQENESQSLNDLFKSALDLHSEAESLGSPKGTVEFPEDSEQQEKEIKHVHKTPVADTPLQQLLRFCGHNEQSEKLPTMDELLGRHVDLNKVKKIGEGTFGEAFKAGSTVLKIVPMECDTLVNGEPQKRADEILAEVLVTMTLSDLRNSKKTKDNSQSSKKEDETKKWENEMTGSKNFTSGFVETYGVGVCKGKYAPALLKEWHRWDDEYESENDPVDIFKDEQLYVVFVVADGGVDLEHFEPESYQEIQSILLQATLTLAVAEEACCFEHRDLHWGNILITRDGTESVTYRLRGVDITVKTAGVKVTLIDFTLSRLIGPENQVAFCDLSADPEIFNGPKGDPQAETYRRMMKATRGEWKSYCPFTNVLWIRYLVEIVLLHKMPNSCGSGEKLALRNFKKESTMAESASDLVLAELFGGLWTSEG